jgi:hypothetical protein
MDGPTLLRAGRAAHLRIVLISLAATIVVVLVGLNARMDPAGTARSTAAIKAQPASAFAGNEGPAVR